MSRHTIRIFALVCAFALIEVGALSTAHPRAVVARQEKTPESTPSEPPGGFAIEPIEDGTIDDVLAIARVIRITRVTLPPDAIQATYSVLPSVYTVEEGPVEFAIDQGLPVPAIVVRAANADSLRYSLDLVDRSVSTPTPDDDSAPDDSSSYLVLVLPGTSLALDEGDALSVPATPDEEAPYAAISAFNRSGETITYIDVEIFPSANPHVLSSAGDPEIEGLDLSLGLRTAQAPAPDWIVVERLTLAGGASVDLPNGVPLLTVVQEGAATLSVVEGDVAVQRAMTRWVDTPESLRSGDSGDLTGGDATFMLPGTTAALTNVATDPLTAIVVTLRPLTRP